MRQCLNNIAGVIEIKGRKVSSLIDSNVLEVKVSPIRLRLSISVRRGLLGIVSSMSSRSGCRISMNRVDTVTYVSMESKYFNYKFTNLVSLKYSYSVLARPYIPRRVVFLDMRVNNINKKKYRLHPNCRSEKFSFPRVVKTIDLSCNYITNIDVPFGSSVRLLNNYLYKLPTLSISLLYLTIGREN